MDGAITDTEASVFPSNPSPRSEEKQEDHEREKKEGHDIFSRLIYGGEAEAESGKEDKGEQRGIVKEGKEEEEEKSGGTGILTHLISNLVSPLSPKAEQVTKQKHQVAEIDQKEDSETVEVGGNGGGIISNLISKLFHQSNEGGEKREGDKEESLDFVGGRKKAKIDKEGGEKRGGFIDSIVSHLPTSLPG